MEDNYSSRIVRRRQRGEVAATLLYVPVSYFFDALSPGPRGPQVVLWTCQAIAAGASFVLAEWVAWMIDRSASARYADDSILRNLATELGTFIVYCSFIGFSSLPAILIGAIDASSLFSKPILICLLFPLIGVCDLLVRHYRKRRVAV